MRGHMWLNKVASVLGPLNYQLELSIYGELYKRRNDAVYVILVNVFFRDLNVIFSCKNLNKLSIKYQMYQKSTKKKRRTRKIKKYAFITTLIISLVVKY